MIADQVYVASMLRDTESMILHTRTPAYIAQHHNLYGDILASILGATFLGVFLVRMVACWQSQKK